MENITKVQIAIGLFTGVIISLFVFMGTIAGNFLLEITKKLSEKSRFIIGLIFLIALIAFIVLGYITLRYALKILFNPSSTDFHSFGDTLRKILQIP